MGHYLHPLIEQDSEICTSRLIFFNKLPWSPCCVSTPPNCGRDLWVLFCTTRVMVLRALSLSCWRRPLVSRHHGHGCELACRCGRRLRTQEACFCVSIFYSGCLCIGEPMYCTGQNALPYICLARGSQLFAWWCTKTRSCSQVMLRRMVAIISRRMPSLTVHRVSGP